LQISYIWNISEIIKGLFNYFVKSGKTQIMNQKLSRFYFKLKILLNIILEIKIFIFIIDFSREIFWFLLFVQFGSIIIKFSILTYSEAKKSIFRKKSIFIFVSIIKICFHDHFNKWTIILLDMREKITLIWKIFLDDFNLK